MSIFKTAYEFIELDNRRNRTHATTTVESLTEKFKVQLPEELIKDKRILDLGCCLAAAGHHALTYGAKHYTGVDIQQYYTSNAISILSKYWPNEKFTIIEKDIEQFLDETNEKYDYVLAAGVIYGFMDVIGILKKIARVSSDYVMIDTLSVPIQNNATDSGVIMLTQLPQMVKADQNVVDCYDGISSRIDLQALDIVLGTAQFKREGDLIKPIPFVNSPSDPYNSLINYPKYNNFVGTPRFMVRYKRVQEKQFLTLQDKMLKDAKSPTQSWVFDSSVADRFQHEAETNIPSYSIVIDKCLQFANKYLNKQDKIIDVGSALGYTINKFINAGFINVMGVDNSEAMIEKSMHKSLVICSDTLPDYQYKLVLMNWTLHFIDNKESYLRDIFKHLDDGYLILTDKCSQSELVKDMYYDFKRSKGVSDEYIKQKEKNLVGVMKSVSVDWYLRTLKEIGFSVDIIHGDFGFITFLCSKHS